MYKYEADVHKFSDLQFKLRMIPSSIVYFTSDIILSYCNRGFQRMTNCRAKAPLDVVLLGIMIIKKES